MNFQSGDTVVFKIVDREHRSKISKVDGNVVKLFDEKGSYRQMSKSSLEEMIRNGFATIEKSTQK